jgi:hypothetical protein
MEATMLQSSTTSSIPGPTIIDRVGEALAALACTRVWVRGAGRHILLGQGAEEPFARVTALGAGSYGLAFHGGIEGTWELLLIDDLRGVVEHALVGADALSSD